jgi:uncharacterized UPF0160 family protein
LSDKALCQSPYFLTPSQTGQWRIQTVPVEPGLFEDRKPLPKEWARLSDIALQNETGIDDTMFCHNSFFNTGSESLESTIKMCSIDTSTIVNESETEQY